MSATREESAARERRGTLVRAGIVGLGGALPDRVVPNAEITPAIGVDDDWIVRRTVIDVIRPIQWPDRVQLLRWCSSMSSAHVIRITATSAINTT